MNKRLLGLLLAGQVSAVYATDYELFYKEEELGVEPYISKVSVSDRYIRVDDLSDDSGFVLYDDETENVYSVSHFDKSILVIKREAFQEQMPSKSLSIVDKVLEDAPMIGGKLVNDYRVELKAESIEEMCTHIQYVPGLLPEVGRMMHRYQLTMTGNHVRTLEQVPLEFQTPCMLSDQVYFDGAVYAKGLPIMEWRSNGKKRYLQSFDAKELDASLFVLPETYRQFSLN